MAISGLLLMAVALVGCNGVDASAGAEEAVALGQTRQALTVTLQPGPEGKDSVVFSLPGQTNVPRGDLNKLLAMSWTFNSVPGTYRGLIDFDIPPPPAGATLTQARLELFAELSGGGHSQLTGTNEMRVLQITSPWEESTVTWDTQPSTLSSDPIVLPPSTSASQNYSIDVTRFVARELANPSQYHGFMLQLQTEQSYRALQFASSDHTNAALRPRLVLEYSTSTPPVGSISGTVVDDRDRSYSAIRNARVDAGNGHFTFTNDQGQFTLSNLPLGNYTLRASLSDWTFGSPQFQNDHYTVSLASAGQTVQSPNIIGWHFDPVVFVHGWTNDHGEFWDIPHQLRLAGYYTVTKDLDTSVLWTPPLEVNARLVKQWVQEAKDVTGRSKVILYGSSMGGLVARAYVEGFKYDSDVSQIFTYGSPHLGIPSLLATGCFALPRPDAICEMTSPGMDLFNLVHFKRRNVDYHLIAGDAPMWTHIKKCMKIFKKKICINIPWPDTSFRNGAGWAMGVLILGKDDGFIQTASSSGQIGLNIDRFLTREVHMSKLGDRFYHAWDRGPSQEGFWECSRRILINHDIRTCGTRKWLLSPPGSFLTADEGGGATDRTLSAGDESSAGPELDQLSRVDEDVLHAGDHRVRLVSVEGGPTSFSASWGEGTVGFTLIDPTGKVIDPAYVASLEGDPNDPENEEVEVADPDAVVHVADQTRASYYFPAARPGTWQIVLDGGGDLPAAGTRFTTAGSFDSRLSAEFSSDRLSYDPGGMARLRVRLSEPVSSADVRVAVARAGNVLETVRLVRTSATEYTASYTVPGPAGYVALDWAVSGQRADGVAFERGGREFLQVHSTSLRLASGHTDHATPREDVDGLNSALVVTLKVQSDYEGAELGAFGELVAPDGTVVASSVVSAPARLGMNDVELLFSAEDIYSAKADGPYTLRNVKLLDQRDAPLLSQEIALAYTTGAYAYRSFAPQLGTPSVFLEGPFEVNAGESVTLTAAAVDPEGDALTYAWDLDDDGTFEVSGQTVPFTSSSADPPGLRTVRVRVSDPEGNFAIGESSVDIFAPPQNRPPVARCRSVAVPSDPSCGASDSVNDGSYDPDEGDTFTCVQTPGGPYSVGSRQVTLTCTDSSGLSSSCEATVTVMQSGQVTLTLNGDSPMTLECGVDKWADPGAQAWDACGPLEVHRYNSGQDPYGPGPNASVQGTYSVQYAAWDAAGHTVSAVRTVSVKDRTPPTLALKGPARMTHTCGSAWVDPGVEAPDACYGNLAPSVVRTGGYVNGWVAGVYTVRYDVKDGAGNSAPPLTRTVEVVTCPW